MGTPATKAKAKYNAKAYDRIELAVQKGKKEEYKNRAANAGKSLNQYIIDCVEADRGTKNNGIIN